VGKSARTQTDDEKKERDGTHKARNARLRKGGVGRILQRREKGSEMNRLRKPRGWAPEGGLVKKAKVKKIQRSSQDKHETIFLMRAGEGRPHQLVGGPLCRSGATNQQRGGNGFKER